MINQRRAVFTNENHNSRDHTNESQNKTKVIEIPEHLRQLYEAQTGNEVSSTYFREPGAHIDTSNTVREFVGTTLREPCTTGTETVFEFDFNHEPYETDTKPGTNIRDIILINRKI